MEKFDIKKIRAIIGLGNPGDKYYKTRHSIGFRILDELAEKFSLSWQSNEKMEYAQNHLFPELNKPIFFIKPRTYMNNSGQVISFLTKKGIAKEEILVIHDELEKDFGYINIKFGGGARGHNGLRSIISVIGQDFWRLNLGIGRPLQREDVGNFVLSNFTNSEENDLKDLIPKIVDRILNN